MTCSRFQFVRQNIDFLTQHKDVDLLNFSVSVEEEGLIKLIWTIFPSSILEDSLRLKNK